MRNHACLTTWRDLFLFATSPLAVALHETGHVVMAMLLGAPPSRERTRADGGTYQAPVALTLGFDFAKSANKNAWWVETASLGYLVSSNLKNGLISAGPLLLGWPLAGYLLAHPLFDNPLANGLLVGELFQAGIEVYFSVRDRAQIIEAAAPLGYLVGGFLAGGGAIACLLKASAWGPL